MKILTLITVFLFSINTYSQETTCGLTDATTQNLFNCLNSNFNFSNSIKLDKITNDILKKIGLEQKNFRVLSCNSVNNALAFNFKNERYIVADQIFLNYLNQNDKTNDYWFYLFILSHEIAHHLNGHTLKKELNFDIKRKQELECDKFAGFILAKYGANKEIINRILNKIPHPKVNNSTHPILNDRLNSAFEGYTISKHDEEKNLAKYKNQILNEYKKNILLNHYYDALFYASDFYYNGSYDSLDKAIFAYNNIINQNQNIIDIESLAILYDFKNDYKNAKKYYDTLYLKTKNPKYALSSFAISYDGNLNYTENLDGIQYTTLEDISSLNNLVLYKISKKDYNSAKNILEKSVEKFKNTGYTSDFNEKISYLSLINNLVSFYVETNENSKLRENVKLLEDKILEFTSVTDINSLLSIVNFDKTTFELQKIAPMLKSYYYHSGVSKNRDKKFAESSVDFNFVKGYFPSSNVIIDGRYDYFQGINYMNLNELETAEYHFLKIINENLNFKDLAYLNLGQINLKLKKQEKAIDYLKKACNLGQNEACNLLNNKPSNSSEYDIDKAIKFLKKHKGKYEVNIFTYELNGEKWEKTKSENGEVNIDLQSISYLKKGMEKPFFRELVYNSFDNKNNMIVFYSQYGYSLLSPDMRRIIFLDNNNDKIYYEYSILRKKD